MNILNEEIVYLYAEKTETFVGAFITAAFIGVVIGIYIATQLQWDVMEGFLLVLACVTLCSLVTLIPVTVVKNLDKEAIAEKTQYEIAVDEFTNINEILERYDLIESKGKKLIVQDKEWHYYEGYEK